MDFASVFADKDKPQTDIVTESLRFPSSNIALVDGTVNQKDVDQTVQSTRFSIVLVKQKGEWLISSATETPIATPAAANPLQPLEWLVGNWSADRDGASVTMNAEWVPSKNFIMCKFETQKPGGAKQTEVQIIGWDPREERPVSWHFDSNGGFGQGTWTQRANGWQVDASGVERNGSTTTSTNVFSRTDSNSFSWQSVNRRVDGVTVGDTVPLKVQRVIAAK
jgi:hypothetical protein